MRLIQKRQDSRINNFNPNENLRATIKLESKNQADISITTFGMRDPIKIKTDWPDIQKNYEQYFLKQKLRDKSPENKS